VHFRQFYLGCLAQASYLIGSEGEAAVVDPRRDVDPYLAEAAAHGLAIRYVIETHLHADFVSGHRELAARTGAVIVFGSRARVDFEHRAVRDADELRLGALRLTILETPGHTPESVSVLVTDPAQGPEPALVLTGDTLFVGDVGRPDLVAGGGFSPESMASMLYDSLHAKLLKLPDSVRVFPGHGAGSLCGRSLSDQTSSTIGEQRRGNYALRPMSRERFIAMTTADLPEQPRHFARDVEINRTGAQPIAERALPARLEPDVLEALLREGAELLDVRSAAAFGGGHVPGAVNVGLEGQFATWAGALLDPERPLALAAGNDGAIAEAQVRLSRVGRDAIAGYLADGVDAWSDSGRSLRELPQLDVDQLDERRATLQVLDVRRPAEFRAGRIPGARNLPLDRLRHGASELDPGIPTAVICAGGYRSSAGASLLLGRGFREVYNVAGGTQAWEASGRKTETT
jgi:hydroxyacylglutathione hydrolase